MYPAALDFHVRILSYFWYQLVDGNLTQITRYLCNALDKGNVGNAKTDGWDHVSE